MDLQPADGFARLWTPWRLEYVKDPSADEGCPFCLDDDARYVLHRGEHCFVILNAFPYNPGHVMVIPYRHLQEFTELTDAERHEIADLTDVVIRALRDVSAPHGFNVGMNLGAVAGAGIATHLHQHVVPRWGGDTNFMPVVGRVRVLPELLDSTFGQLTAAVAEVLDT